MFPDFRAIMRARLGLGRPLDGYAMGNEGRDPRPQTFGGATDFQQPPAPEPWVSRPNGLSASYDPSPKTPNPIQPESWVPRPVDMTKSLDANPGGANPRYSAMKSPWQRF